jgi:hypothetical protein
MKEEHKMSLQKKIYGVVGTILFVAAAWIASIGLSYAETAASQTLFKTPQEAVAAFVDALRKDDNAALKAILGPESADVISSGDETADKIGRAKFLSFFDEKNQIVNDGENKAEIVIGNDEWPFPIPIVKQNETWFFDTKAGKEEILDRRVGRNECKTIQVLLAVVDAEREYAIKDHDGDGLLEYAQKFRSDAGTKNGLFWKAAEGEQESPLGPLAAVAQEENYVAKAPEEGPQPYHGYLFKILKKQGLHAKGGAYDYLVKDNMIGGFAVVAQPAQYGNSGVLTFVVNHDGVVFEKDLGPDTAEIVANMDVFDPDASWQKSKTDVV